MLTRVVNGLKSPMDDRTLEPGDVGPRQIRLVTRDPYNFGSSLHMFRKTFDGYEVAQPGDWIAVKYGDQLPKKPFIDMLHREELQMLMDGLYEMGVRPTHEVNTDGRVAHITEHLEDMRAIAFKKLGMSDE